MPQIYRTQFLERLSAQDIEGSMAVIDQAVKAGISPDKVMLRVVTSAMEEIGERQANQEITLSEVFVMATIGDSAINHLLPLMPEPPAQMGKIVLGTVQDDFHSLGRKIVRSFLRVAGFNVIDLGANVPATRFVETALDENAPIIAASALLLHTANHVKDIRRELQNRNAERWIKLIVGGAAFTIDRELYRTVGADAMAPNALNGVTTIRAMLRAMGRLQ